MTESEFESILDAAVMRRLNSDFSYKNAANAQEQKAREEQIEEEEYVRLSDRYNFYGLRLI